MQFDFYALTTMNALVLLNSFNPLPSLASVLTKQKAIYTVLTPSIKNPIYIYKFLWPYGKFMTQSMRHWLVKS